MVDGSVTPWGDDEMFSVSALTKDDFGVAYVSLDDGVVDAGDIDDDVADNMGPHAHCIGR